MRQFFAFLLVIGSVTLSALSFQAGSGTSSGDRISACSLLTRDLVIKHGTAEGKRVVDLLPPQEDDLSTNGSACEYGGIGLQIDPFARQQEMRTSMGKEWLPVSGVGETAYFRNNSNRFAELIVWSGAHHFTIQMGVPTGATAESVKPNTIALANELIPKLR